MRSHFDDLGPTYSRLKIWFEGPCMEYLLHQNILETLCTFGRGDTPPGMKQQVLSFVTKLLGKIKQPLLPHVNVHKPIIKLVSICGEVMAAPTEREEVHFLCVVCSKVISSFTKRFDLVSEQ